MSWDIGGIVKSIAPAFIGLAGGLIMNNQQVQKAKGEANDAKALADLQYQTAYANAQAQALALANQANSAKPPEKPKSNTALYVGLGVGGGVLLGVVIFAVTRK